MSKASLLKEYIKPIVHMRQQCKKEKFGLVFGSGISKPFKLPNWEELIKKIANNPQVNGKEILNYNKRKGSQASTTQMLYEHFKSKEVERLNTDGSTISKETEKIIYKLWRDVIHKELWSDFDFSFLNKGRHPYLDSYIDIIKSSNLTINYNFDDTLQTLISKRRTDSEINAGKKLYETVYDARLQFQSSKGIIYHPNGFLPFNLIEGASDGLVFSEDSFADQLIASMSGHYSTLLHHLSKNTCLFIGLSLDDNTLKHLLRQSATINPGHYHYYVAFVKDVNKVRADQLRAIRESNFEMYNLVTLFLNNDDIKNLGEVLQLGETEFGDDCKLAKVKRKFVYYLTGAVGCGKTTTLSYFRNLTTYSEWPEQRLDLLAKNASKLTASQENKVDKWIYSMFYLKNKNLTHEDEGITIIDRTPLDPLTFTPINRWKNKANKLNDNINPNGAFKIVPGQIILLHGNKEVIASRNRMRQKKSSYDSKDIEEMYKKYTKAFESIKNGVRYVETTELSIHEVVKRVAKIIHLDEYTGCDLHSVLESIINKK